MRVPSAASVSVVVTMGAATVAYTGNEVGASTASSF
jgi:hypothetical protein